MRRAFAISVALWGCGDPEAAQLFRVKEAVCACKTTACAQAALNEVPKPEIKSSHKSQRIVRDMLDCLARIYDEERPSTDPDAPTVPETSAPASARTP